jgi:hypothetical protein
MPGAWSATSSEVRTRPYTVKGWRPISVTHQPAMVAIQPEKVMAASRRSCHGE